MNDETPIEVATPRDAGSTAAGSRTARFAAVTRTVNPGFVPFFACREPSRRRLNAALQLGAASFVLSVLSLYFAWDDGTGPLVHDPVNLWFNCIPLGAFAVALFCLGRPRHRTAGAVAFVGLTAGLLYINLENAFGMFTYNDANPANGFWLGLASYVVMLVAAILAAQLVAHECCKGCLPDRRPRSPWLVLGLGVLGIGWIVARFLPDYVISVRRTPIDESGNALNETLDTDLLHRGMVARLEGVEFIPEIAGWVIFLLVAPLAAWMLRRQLAAALIGGFLVYAVADVAATLTVSYSLDYTRDSESGVRLAVDRSLGRGSLALIATTALFIIVVAAIYLSGTEHPVAGEAPAES